MIVSYELETGKITGAHEPGGGEEAYLELLRSKGLGGVRLGIDPQTYYVRDGVIVPRPEAQIQLDKDVVGVGPEDRIVLSGVPAGASIQIAGPTGTHRLEGTGEDLPIGFGLPGVYEIQIDPFPARIFIKRVTVQP